MWRGGIRQNLASQDEPMWAQMVWVKVQESMARYVRETGCRLGRERDRLSKGDDGLSTSQCFGTALMALNLLLMT